MHRERPKAHHVLLLSAGVLLIALAFISYIALNANLATPNTTILAEYYAMVGAGAALVLAGVADLAIHQWGLYLEQVIREQNQVRPPDAGQA